MERVRLEGKVKVPCLTTLFTTWMSIFTHKVGEFSHWPLLHAITHLFVST